jgi:hypothetical protein
LRPKEDIFSEKHIQKAAHNPEDASESLLKHINVGGCFLQPFLHPKKSELWRCKNYEEFFNYDFPCFSVFIEATLFKTS